MSESGKSRKNEITTQVKPFDIFGNVVQEIENAMKTWSTSPWMPSIFDYNGQRLPLCEIADRGDRYELNVEVPGMGKENVNVKASSQSIEVSAKKSKRTEERKEGRIYTERSESSFYRQIPMPEEIMPRKVKSKVKNGVLFVEIPKKNRNVQSEVMRLTRMRNAHNYHEVKVLNPETFCTKCNAATPRVCEWCGACSVCHKGVRMEENY